MLNKVNQSKEQRLVTSYFGHLQAFPNYAILRFICIMCLEMFVTKTTCLGTLKMFYKFSQYNMLKYLAVFA